MQRREFITAAVGMAAAVASASQAFAQDYPDAGAI
jgi:Cys-rich four helix bundle protein (predicted Tat secretion target)